MAIIKHKAIRSASHISHVVEYNTNDKKTNDNLTTGVNCDYRKVKEEFELAKILHDKSDCIIIAHQYIQSFKPGEVTPEIANEIGVRLIDKVAPGYQALVVTHIDKDHIHNHIVINSVNIETGYMYDANKGSLQFVRNVSDDIIKEYGLSVITEKSGLRGIDQETYNLAIKGQSWKVKMINSIDEAISFSNTKDEFINYMTNLGYEVKWQNENISFKDPNEQLKFIRAKSLAKQFGEEYSKEGIEKRIGEIKEFESDRNSKDVHGNERINTNDGYNNVNNSRDSEEHARRIERNKKRNSKNEHERYEQWKREHENYLQKTSSSLDRNFYKLGQISKVLDINKPKGKNKDEAKEETFRILLFVAMALSMSAKRAIAKNQEKKLQFKINKIKLKQLIGNSDFKELNNIPGENKFIKLKLDELKKLKNVDVKYSGYIKNDSIIVMVKEDDLRKLLDGIGRRYEAQYGNITYNILKENSDKLEFRIIDEKLLNELHKSDLKFSCFKKEDKFNVSFNAKDLDTYNKVVQLSKNRDRNISR